MSNRTLCPDTQDEQSWDRRRTHPSLEGCPLSAVRRAKRKEKGESGMTDNIQYFTESDLKKSQSNLTRCSGRRFDGGLTAEAERSPEPEKTSDRHRSTESVAGAEERGSFPSEQCCSTFWLPISSEFS